MSASDSIQRDECLPARGTSQGRASNRSEAHQVVSLLLAHTPTIPAPPVASCRDFDLSRHDVLILSADALAAALLGAAVELAGHQPHFPKTNEVAREALRRVRPRLVVVDCDHDGACEESFVGPVIMTGALLLLFDSQRHGDGGVNVARRLGLDVVHLPDDHEVLVRKLRELSD